MPNNLKLRIILPVILLNIIFLVCLVVHAAMLLSATVPGQTIHSLLITVVVWTTAWLVVQVAVMVVIAGRLERNLRAFSEQAAEIARGHIRSAAPAGDN